MHIQPHRFTQISDATQISRTSRFTNRKLIGVIAVLIVGSLGVATVLQNHPLAWLPLTWLGVFAVGWVPVSLWMLRGAVNRAYTRATDDNAQQAQHQIEIFRATRRDSLTGLPTRAVFSEMLAGLVCGEKPAALLVIDLDNFSKINGQHGDGTGDDLLRAFADRLRTIAGQRDRVGRLDGDEFALLLDRPDDLRKLDETTAFIQARLTEPFPTAGVLLDVSVSVGVALAPQHGHSTEALLRGARQALQHAKAAGGATWRLCGQDESDLLRKRMLGREELSHAIENGQIIPYYQPIVTLPANTVSKLEVLARWDHPTLGLLEPEHFIPLAEEVGLSGVLSMSLLRQVAIDIQNWPSDCRFAINASAGQLRELITFVRDQPGDWQRRMDISRLDVEMTETALMRDRKLVAELIEVLHDNGARAGLDNFGNGYSNFFHLRELPFDTLKIAKNFIADMLTDTRAESCVMAMMWLSHGLGIQMIADGVENAEVAARLAKMGCHFAQGFHYAHPVPAAEVADLLHMANRAAARAMA
jgi:diguanylate cyclase (GGDEF)-like protein